MDGTLTRIVATSDVHSHMGDLAAMLGTLETARASALVVDCGDFFEGTGFYQLGAGVLETRVLCGFYDVVAPGNHGFGHHLADPALHMKTVCANIRGISHLPVFDPVRFHRVSGAMVAVTGVMGAEAFETIPAEQRKGLTCQDSAEALTMLYERNRAGADTWVVLSHSGWDADVKLAEACPFLDVVFAAHCHSNNYGPLDVGGVTVAKGGEHAAGYSWAEPTASGWSVGRERFADQPHTDVSPETAELLTSAAELEEALTTPVGRIRAGFRDCTPDRRELLRLIAAGALLSADADVALLNDTALRPAPLGRTLTVGDVLELAPFDNRLVTVDIRAGKLADLATRMSDAVGPVLVEPRVHFDAARIVRTVTTAYLAETHLRLPALSVGTALTDVVAVALTENARRAR